jgi:hypothetical protein
VAAFGQELSQAFGRERNGVGARHADDVETLRSRSIGERGPQRSRIA